MAYPPVNPDDGQSKFAIFNVDPLRVTPPDVKVESTSIDGVIYTNGDDFIAALYS